MKTSEWIGCGAFIILFVFCVALVFWAFSHPLTDANVACVRSGYDRATYVYVFAPEPYCEKTVRVKLSDIKE